MPTGWLARLGLGALLIGPPADERTIVIEWDQPAPCEQDGFRMALLRHLGQGHDLRSERVLGAQVKVRQLPDDTWVLDLSLRTTNGIKERHFVADRCDTVTDAAAFATAVAIDPTIATASLGPALPPPRDLPEVQPHPDPTSPVRHSTPEMPPRPAVSPVAEPKRRLFGHVRADLGVAAGVLPAASASLSLAAGVHGTRWWRVEALALWEGTAVAVSLEDPQAGGRFSLWAAGARACAVPRFGTIDLLACAGLEGGQIAGRGFGFPGADLSRLPYGAAEFGAGVAWRPLLHLALVARAELALPLVRHEFGIEGLGTVHRMGAAAFRGFGGFETRF